MRTPPLHAGSDPTCSYQSLGTGHAVVLVHGFPADARIWDAVLPELQPGFRLLLPDLPGSGASARLPDLSIESMAECLVHMLDAEQIQRCILVGHSMGGYVSLAFAERHPERLLGLGLFHATAFADSESKKQDRRKAIALMQRYGSQAFLQQMVPNMFGPTYRKTHPEVIQQVLDRYQDAPRDILADYYSAMMQRPDRSWVLSAIQVPVLFTTGTEDQAAPMSDILQQIPRAAISDMHLWPAVGHMGMLEAPEAGSVLASFARFCLQLQSVPASC